MRLSVPKWILIGTCSLFTVIGVVALFKIGDKELPVAAAPIQKPQTETPVMSMPAIVPPVVPAPTSLPRPAVLSKEDFPSIDRHV